MVTSSTMTVVTTDGALAVAKEKRKKLTVQFQSVLYNNKPKPLSVICLIKVNAPELMQKSKYFELMNGICYNM